MRLGAMTMGRVKAPAERRSRSLAVAVISMLAILAIACGEDPTTGPTAADYRAERERLLAQMKQKKANEAQSAPQDQQPGVTAEGESVLGGFGTVGSKYAYEAKGKRDPFEAYRHKDSDRMASIQTPLMAYELEQLAVVAVVWDTGNRRALVADPRGETHLVREGSPIGKNDGLVIHIGDNMVLVKETYVDFAGEMTTKDVELRIQRSQGG
jgi:Tfp pilus assembly protein PilP